MEHNQGEHDLTEFQHNCERRLHQCLEQLGIKFKNREIRWIGEPAIWAEFADLHVWIYIDEAEIGGEGVEWHYEKYDYGTPDHLIEAFVDKVAFLLRT